MVRGPPAGCAAAAPATPRWIPSASAWRTSTAPACGATSDRGKPVDARGELIDSDVDGPYSGPIELAHKLAGSRQVHDCLATQWFRYGTGRREGERDSCSLGRLKQAFTAGKGDIRQLLVAFTQTDTFLFRSKGDQP